MIETIRQWQAAMRRKLAKANSWATEFVRDTLAGKPAVSADVTVNAPLAAFLEAWNDFNAADEAGEDKDRASVTGDRWAEVLDVAAKVPPG